MITLDGYELKDGDECFVQIEDPENESGRNGEIMEAIYQSENAKEMGWDYELPKLGSDDVVEIVAVWRTNPAPSQG